MAFLKAATGYFFYQTVNIVAAIFVLCPQVQLALFTQHRVAYKR